MYTLKSYFYVQADQDRLNKALVDYPQFDIMDNAVVVDNKHSNMRVVEVSADALSKVAFLAEEFPNDAKAFWMMQKQIDFAHLQPEKNCNSFVLVAFGTYQVSEFLAKQWQEASLKETGKLYPVVISCHQEQSQIELFPQQETKTHWTEFRGHFEKMEPEDFANIRKICKHFTKSNPYFFQAKKLEF